MQHEPLRAILGRWICLICFCASVILAFYLFENWRGQRAWRRLVAAAKAEGEPLEWKAFVAPSVPDDQNFMATPFLHGISERASSDPGALAKLHDHPLTSFSFDCSVWRSGKPLDLRAVQAFLDPDKVIDSEFRSKEAATRILQALANLDPEFAELRKASLRPFAQFRGGLDPAGSVPNFVTLRQLAYLLALRTSSEIALGQKDEAFADAWVIQRLAAALQLEPYLVAEMVGCAILGNMGLQTFWEGLGQWSDAQLRQFQTAFLSTDLIRAFDRSMRGGERAGLYSIVQGHKGGLDEIFVGGKPSPGFGPFLERLYYRAWPRGWIYQNQVYHHWVMQQTALQDYDARAQRVYPEKCREGTTRLNSSISRWNPFSQLTAMGIPNFPRALEVSARTQTAVNQASVACALELARRARHEYPANLEALVPEFIDRLPHDLINGQPLVYRKLTADTYLLYAVGWDGKDDGGRAEKPVSPGPAMSAGDGDWVWPLATQSLVTIHTPPP